MSDPKEIIEDGYKLVPKDFAAKVTALFAAIICFLVYVIWSNYSASVSAAIDGNNQRIERIESFVFCTLHAGGFDKACGREFRQ